MKEKSRHLQTRISTTEDKSPKLTCKYTEDLIMHQDNLNFKCHAKQGKQSLATDICMNQTSQDSSQESLLQYKWIHSSSA